MVLVGDNTNKGENVHKAFCDYKKEVEHIVLQFLARM